MVYNLKVIQKALNARGFEGANQRPLIEDGIAGPNTSYAIIKFKRSKGLKATDYVGPITYAKLTGDDSEIKAAIPKTTNPPWYDEMLSMLGKHESRDYNEVSAWLKSDGGTVGDPRKNPYCGDAVQTSLRLHLPNEPMPANPYLASSWATWGRPVEPQRGSIMSFWRESPASWKGHVGFYAGESQHDYYILGANQSDSFTISPIAKNRLRKNGSRWPHGGPPATGQKMIMSGGTVSTNEA
jgi:hypothetical protein